MSTAVTWYGQLLSDSEVVLSELSRCIFKAHVQ
jgi:hypothetical protein